ncbi:MAG: TatD family hydrolase [Anaerolineae bacterium]
MRLIDTHCHLNFDSYDADRTAVMARAAEAGVNQIIIPATDLNTSREALDLAHTHTGIYAAVGIHPNSTADFTPAMIDAIRTLAAEAKVVAIGEIGLDYYWDNSPPDTQKRAFQAQLDLAAELQLPVIIHNRDASEDVMAMLESWVRDIPEALRARPGVLHSFSAPPDIAERALAAGFYLGFTGPITFKKADELRHIAARVPLERLLVETDGPFLTPHPYRGQRNEPAYVFHVADRLAALHQMTTEKMGEITTANAQHLFNLSE